MKKIAIILATKPDNGGGHQYAMLIAECLAENAGSGYELVAICHNSFWKRWCKKNKVKCIDAVIPNLERGERIINCKFPHLMQIYNFYLTPMGKILRQECIDILFSVQQFFFIPNYGVKIIVPVHDLMHRYESNFPEVKMDYDKREMCMQSYIKYAHVILTDSKLGIIQLKEIYGVGTNRMPNIISLPFTVPSHIYGVHEKKIDVPNKYIFYPAQFWKHKNHINLVKAIQMLKDEIQDIHLVLVGSEKNCYQEIKEYILKNGLQDNITILGFVSNENITYLYKHAVGMVMPSYFGPTNIPPLEAMALGCPVAVSDKYAMSEQIGNAGLLFNPDSPEEIANCIKRLWTDDRLRDQMRELGYIRIRRWSKSQFNEKLLKILQRM